MNIDYSHRELFMKVKKDNLKFFVYWISQTRLRNIILKLRHRDKTWIPWLKYIMKVRPRIRPVWPGIRIWMRSAGNYPCLPREENPGGRTGYPKNHWDSFFVRPKCSKIMGLTGFPNSSPRGLNLK
jgi:hypothetical protein